MLWENNKEEVLSEVNSIINEAREVMDKERQLYEPYIDLYFNNKKGYKSTISDLEGYNKWFWGEKEKLLKGELSHFEISLLNQLDSIEIPPPNTSQPVENEKAKE